MTSEEEILGNRAHVERIMDLVEKVYGETPDTLVVDARGAKEFGLPKPGVYRFSSGKYYFVGDSVEDSLE